MKKKVFGLLAIAIISAPLLSTLPLADAAEFFPFAEYRDPSLQPNEVCVLPPTNLKVGYTVDWKATGGSGLYFSNSYLTDAEIATIEMNRNIIFERNEVGPLLQVYKSNECPAGMEITFAAYPPKSCKVGASPLIGNGPLPIFPEYVDGVVHTCTPIVLSSITPSEPLPMPLPIPLP